ncbi:hypothetical protein PMAYCL1PPCAC_30565, partial [Pristionchus mayeri]
NVDDRGSGIATFTVSCNQAGTGWEAEGRKIVKVECTAVPACKTCAANLIQVTELMEFGWPMEPYQIDMSGACSEISFTCMRPGAGLSFYDEGGIDTNINPGTDTATFTVACNQAGTGWLAGASKVVKVECTAVPTCKTCSANLITVYRDMLNSKPMEDGV